MARRHSWLLAIWAISPIVYAALDLPAAPETEVTAEESKLHRAAADRGHRMATTLKTIRASLMQRRHAPIKSIGAWLKRVVQGYLNYHAVPGNLKRLGMFRAEVCRAWLRALRRRSQRSPMTWERFQHLIALHIPKVRTPHPYPSQRFAS